MNTSKRTQISLLKHTIQELKAKLSKKQSELDETKKTMKRLLSLVDMELLKLDNSELNKAISSLKPHLPKLQLDKKHDRLCRQCGVGKLKLHKINIGAEIKYFRKCDKCDNRTKLKQFTDSVID